MSNLKDKFIAVIKRREEDDQSKRREKDKKYSAERSIDRVFIRLAEKIEKCDMSPDEIKSDYKISFRFNYVQAVCIIDSVLNKGKINAINDDISLVRAHVDGYDSNYSKETKERLFASEGFRKFHEVCKKADMRIDIKGSYYSDVDDCTPISGMIDVLLHPRKDHYKDSSDANFWLKDSKPSNEKVVAKAMTPKR